MMLADGVVDLARRELAGERELPRLPARRVAVHVPAVAGRALPWLPRIDAPTLVRARPRRHRPADPRHGAAVARGLAGAALRRRRRQRAGVRLHVGLVPGAAGPPRRAVARRRDVRRARRRHRRERPARGAMVAAQWQRRRRLAGLRRRSPSCSRAAVWRMFAAARRRAGRCRRGALADRRAPRRPVTAPAGRGRDRPGSLSPTALAGFGYIVTATFLPVIAREALPGSPWLDLFWPIFGLGVIVGALLATRLRVGRRPALRCSRGAYLIQARGHRARRGGADPRPASRSAASCSACRSPRSPSSRCRKCGACGRSHAAEHDRPADRAPTASARSSGRRWSPRCCAAAPASHAASRSRSGSPPAALLLGAAIFEGLRRARPMTPTPTSGR